MLAGEHMRNMSEHIGGPKVDLRFKMLSQQGDHRLILSNPEIYRPVFSFFYSSFLAGTFSRFMLVYPVFAAASSLKTFSDLTCNMSDGAGPDEVTFCNKESNHRGLIPDHYFMESNGYQVQRDHFEEQPKWDERSDVPFWRGVSTGNRADCADILQLPRARLCRFGLSRSMDFSLSNTVQVTEEEKKQLSYLVGGYSPWQVLSSKKFNIDIDGNTSSWPGLFIKLLSGGVVLKVVSPWRQWYYDRLQPWVNYVPISAELDDLESAVARLKSDTSLAQEIARNGRALALDLNYEEAVRSGAQNIIAMSEYQPSEACA